MSPVAFGVEVAKIEFVLKAESDFGCGTGDLACDECLTPYRGFVVEKDAVAGEHPIRFTVIDGYPIGVHLGYGIGGAWIKRSCLRLWGFLNFSVEL